MRLYALRDRILLHGQVIKLIYHGNIYIYRTGLTVTAAGALSLIRMERRRGNHGGIILLILRGRFIKDSLIHLLYRVITAQYGRNTGPGQRRSFRINAGILRAVIPCSRS